MLTFINVNKDKNLNQLNVTFVKISVQNDIMMYVYKVFVTHTFVSSSETKVLVIIIALNDGKCH